MNEPRAEWGLVAVTTDLMAEARNLSQLAYDFRTEARGWTHPAGRAELERVAVALVDEAQRAALASGLGDYWTRHDALQRAFAYRTSAQATFREWWKRGELFNSHRLRPVPASIMQTAYPTEG